MTQSDVLLKALLQAQATQIQVQAAQNEMLLKALLERSAYRGPSEIEMLRELKSFLPDRTNDIVTGIDLAKRLMGHSTPAASRDDLGTLLRGVLESLRQAPQGQAPPPQPVQHVPPSGWAPVSPAAVDATIAATPAQAPPPSHTQPSVPPWPTGVEIRAAIPDLMKWAHIRTVLAMKFSQQPQPTTPEEARFRTVVADPVAWERVRTMLAANYAPQQFRPVTQPAPNTAPQSVKTAGTEPRLPTQAEFRAAIFDPAKWEYIRTVFAMVLSRQPQPTTPEGARVREVVADPVEWERIRVIAEKELSQPAAVPQPAPNTAPQSVKTAGTVPRLPTQAEFRAAIFEPAKWEYIRTVFAMVLSRQPQPTTPEGARLREVIADPVEWERIRVIAERELSQPAGTRTPSTLATKAPPSSTLPAPNTRAPSGERAEWQHIRTVCAERIRSALTARYTPTETATLRIPSADAKPSAQPAQNACSPGEQAPMATPPPVCNQAARRPTGPQPSAPPRPCADNIPIFCFLTAERHEPVLFGGRRVPIGLG